MSHSPEEAKNFLEAPIAEASGKLAVPEQITKKGAQTSVDTQLVIEIGTSLRALQEALFEYKPSLGDVLHQHGKRNVYDFAQSFIEKREVGPEIAARREKLIAVAKKMAIHRVGAEGAEALAAQLTALPVVSTADHHGFLNDPYFVGTNIISAAGNYGNSQVRYLPAFSFSNVALTNESYPRGIQIHGGEAGEGELLKFPLFPDKLKMGTVYGTRAFNREDIERTKKGIQQKIKEGKLGALRAKKLVDLISSCLETPEVLESRQLASQVTAVNNQLWKKIFAQEQDQSKAPDLVYLEIETLVSELLAEHHLHDPSSPIHQLLFNPKYQESALQHFNKIPGSFSTEAKSGTYMFWGMDERAHRVGLHLDGNRLVSADGKMGINVEPNAISEALRDKKIFPNMLFSYLVVALYHGMKCLGGFSQVNDLTATKDAWGKILQEGGNVEEAERAKAMESNAYGGDGITMAYVRNTEGNLSRASGFDVAISDKRKNVATYAQLLQGVTVEEMIQTMYPGIYKIEVPPPMRDPAIEALTMQQIIKHTGLDQKLDAFCV